MCSRVCGTSRGRHSIDILARNRLTPEPSVDRTEPITWACVWVAAQHWPWMPVWDRHASHSAGNIHVARESQLAGEPLEQSPPGTGGVAAADCSGNGRRLAADPAQAWDIVALGPAAAEGGPDEVSDLISELEYARFRQQRVAEKLRATAVAASSQASASPSPASLASGGRVASGRPLSDLPLAPPLPTIGSAQQGRSSASVVQPRALEGRTGDASQAVEELGRLRAAHAAQDAELQRLRHHEAAGCSPHLLAELRTEVRELRRAGAAAAHGEVEAIEQARSQCRAELQHARLREAQQGQIQLATANHEIALLRHEMLQREASLSDASLSQTLQPPSTVSRDIDEVVLCRAEEIHRFRADALAAQHKISQLREQLVEQRVSLAHAKHCAESDLGIEIAALADEVQRQQHQSAEEGRRALEFAQRVAASSQELAAFELELSQARTMIAEEAAKSRTTSETAWRDIGILQRQLERQRNDSERSLAEEASSRAALLDELREQESEGCHAAAEVAGEELRAMRDEVAQVKAQLARAREEQRHAMHRAGEEAVEVKCQGEYLREEAATRMRQSEVRARDEVARLSAERGEAVAIASAAEARLGDIEAAAVEAARLGIEEASRLRSECAQEAEVCRHLAEREWGAAEEAAHLGCV